MFRGGIVMSIGNVPEVLSQGVLEGIILEGRLDVLKLKLKCLPTLTHVLASVVQPLPSESALGRESRR